MPTGVYERTEEEMQRVRELCKRPITAAQIKVRRENVRKATEASCKLPRTKNQLESLPHADTIVKHHNDLCRGVERPDDITLITHSEHMSLHNNLRVQNGTHNLLAKNRG